MTMSYLMKLGCFIYGQETLGLHRCDRRRNLRVVVHFQGVIRHRGQKASALKSFLGSSILGEEVKIAVLSFTLDGKVSSMMLENNKQNSLEAISCCYLSADVNHKTVLIYQVWPTWTITYETMMSHVVRAGDKVLSVLTKGILAVRFFLASTLAA